MLVVKAHHYSIEAQSSHTFNVGGLRVPANGMVGAAEAQERHDAGPRANSARGAKNSIVRFARRPGFTTSVHEEVIS